MAIEMRNVGIGAVILAVILGGGYYFGSRVVQASPVQTTTVRWLISHQPISVFARSAEVFAEELSRRTDGRLKLEIITPENLGYPSTGDIPHSDVLKYLSDGTVELATTYSVPLGKDATALRAINLPFLFSNYDSARKILDGAGAISILDSVADTTDVHALVFTMSGGFYMFASRVPLTKPADFHGKKIATSGGSVSEATLTALGATAVSMDLESYDREIDLNSIDAVETTYSRLSEVLGQKSSYTNYIAETDHSMFLTVVLSSDSFFSSLSIQDQSALRAAAIAAAQIEREDSIALGFKTKESLSSGGSTVTVFTDEQRQEMKKATQSVYSSFESEFGSQSVKALSQ